MEGGLDTDYLWGIGVFIFFASASLVLLRRWAPARRRRPPICRDDLAGAVRVEKTFADKNRGTMPLRMVFTDRILSTSSSIKDAIVCNPKEADVHHLKDLIGVIQAGDWRPEGIVFDCAIAPAATGLVRLLLAKFCPVGLRLRQPPGGAPLLGLPDTKYTDDRPTWYDAVTQAEPSGWARALCIDNCAFNRSDFKNLPETVTSRLEELDLRCQVLEEAHVAVIIEWLHALPALRRLLVSPQVVTPAAEAALSAKMEDLGRDGVRSDIAGVCYSDTRDPTPRPRRTWWAYVRSLFW